MGKYIILIMIIALIEQFQAQKHKSYREATTEEYVSIYHYSIEIK